MAIHVELLIDHSKDSEEARSLLYGLAKRYPQIKVDGIPANGDDLPIAYYNDIPYRGVDRIQFLRDKLIQKIYEEKIPA